MEVPTAEFVEATLHFSAASQVPSQSLLLDPTNPPPPEQLLIYVSGM